MNSEVGIELQKFLEKPGSEDLHDLYVMYYEKDQNKKFLPVEEGRTDVRNYFKRRLKRYKEFSENYIRVATENPFRRHYKMRSTYVFGEFKKVSRREYVWSMFCVNYIKTQKGLIYFAASPSKSNLTIYSAHVFDRFIERVGQEDNSRIEAISELIERIDSGNYGSYPLIDRETNSSYLPIEDGYLVGHHAAYSKPKSRIVNYFKTFLSHYEVSDKRMELFMKLDKERREIMNAVQERYEKGS